MPTGSTPRLLQHARQGGGGVTVPGGVELVMERALQQINRSSDHTQTPKFMCWMEREYRWCFRRRTLQHAASSHAVVRGLENKSYEELREVVESLSLGVCPNRWDSFSTAEIDVLSYFISRACLLKGGEGR